MNNNSALAPTTPDGLYILVEGRLWRSANPHLVPEVHKVMMGDLVKARRAINTAIKAKNKASLQKALKMVAAAKLALGTRWPVWWTPDMVDYNRRLVKSTPYATWSSQLGK